MLVAACSSALAKPNLVIFLADDAGWGDYSHSGNTQVQTPNIDSLARVLMKPREHGIAENTIVLYFSDNGPNSNRWTGGMKGRKGTTDEGGVRSVCFLPRSARLG